MKLIRRRIHCVWLLTTAAAIVPITLPAQAPSDPAATPSTQASDQGKATSKTNGFLKDVARNNDTGISLAEIGSRQAQNQDLKSFCQKLQQDHMQMSDQLKPLAQQYGVTLDQKMGRKGTREETRLEKLSGQQFDQKLATELLQEHRRAINTFEKALKENQPADVQQFAQSTLPKLQQHFQEAQTVAKTVGVDDAAISSIAKKTNEAVGGTSDESDKGVSTGQSTDKGAGAKQLDQNNPPPQR